MRGPLKTVCEFASDHRSRRTARLHWCAALLALLPVLSGCGQEQPSVRLLNSAVEPSLLFEGFHMVSTQQGEREWDFYARAAQVFERENMARAQDIKVDYWRKGKVTSTLTARRGFLRTDTRFIRAEKEVVMVSEEGAVLRTELLQWDNAKSRIYTDQPVTVEREGSILTGVGLEADSELKHIEVLSQVNIRVKSLKTLRTLQGTPVPERP